MQQRPPERIDKCRYAIDPLVGAFLVRLDVSCRVLSHRHVGRAPTLIDDVMPEAPPNPPFTRQPRGRPYAARR
jgi:hypothetical protein